MLRSIFLGVFIVSIFCLAGCSSAGVHPTDQPIDVNNPQDTKISNGEGHFLWGIYDLYIDPIAMSVEAFPIRSAHPHYDVTGFVTPPKCLDCVKPVIVGFDPVTRIATIQVTLKNPTPINGFDVRGILLLNDAGHDLASPDGWVSIFDDGTYPYFNPFMRYGKTQPNGVFPGGAKLTETYRVVLPKPPKYAAIRYVIDAFWPKNGKREPYDIWDIEVDGYLWDDGSNSVEMTLKVRDRHDDVSAVSVECPGVFNGKKYLTQDGDGWVLQFSNENHAPGKAQPYPITIEAYDSVSSYTLMEKSRVYISPKVYNWISSSTALPIGECSFDVAGVTGGVYDTGSFLVDSDSSCTAFVSYDMDFTLATPALDLVDINPYNLTLQPYPPVRFDSASGGGLVFSNAAEGTFLDGTAYSVDLSQVIVTLDSDLIFKDDQAGDHQAHHAFELSTLAVVDVCDGFQERFYALWAETTGSNLPVVCCYEADYSTLDEVFMTTIPAEFIGNGDGQIVNDADALLAIDAREVGSSPPYENVRLCILEKVGTAHRIEIFNLNTDLGKGETVVTHIETISLPSMMGTPRDIEMLPPNPNYGPLPNNYSLAVVFKVTFAGKPNGYWGVVNMNNGQFVDIYGSSGQPSVNGDPQHLDVNNGTFTVIITADKGDVGENNLGIYWFTYM